MWPSRIEANWAVDSRLTIRRQVVRAAPNTSFIVRKSRNRKPVITISKRRLTRKRRRRRARRLRTIKRRKKKRKKSSRRSRGRSKQKKIWRIWRIWRIRRTRRIQGIEEAKAAALAAKSVLDRDRNIDWSCVLIFYALLVPLFTDSIQLNWIAQNRNHTESVCIG